MAPVANNRTPRAPMVALAVGCVALAGISALDARVVTVVHDLPFGWAHLVSVAAPRWLILAVVLPILFHIAWRFPPWPLRAPRVLLHFALLIGLSSLFASAQAFFMHDGGIVFPFGVAPWAARSLFAAVPIVAFMYAAILLMAWGISQSRERHAREIRAAQLETQLNAARLGALRAQLHPHFLYNTLNGIAAVVEALQPERAVRAIEQLAELLHASFREDGRDVVPLREELALIERYLALQRLRFGERLRYTLDVDPRIVDCVVPVLILQPSVENAVRHGMSGRRAPMHVRVMATAVGEGIEMIVENDGNALPANWTPASEGIGLSNTRARLAVTYGPTASLAIVGRDFGGVVVRIRVPRVAAETATAPAPGERSLKLA